MRLSNLLKNENNTTSKKQVNKNKKINLLILLAMSFLSFSLLFSSCTTSKAPAGDSSSQSITANSDSQSNEATGLEKLTGNLEIIGSTSTQVLVETFADEFTSKNSDVKINYQGVGSSKGIKAVKDTTADIGTSSRELKEEEKSWGLAEYTMAKDGIAISVHPDNKITELTTEQIIKIFTGVITNWKDVGGDDSKIIVSSREAGSGTRGAFEELLGIEDKVIKEALIYDGNGPVKASIASNKAAIGYLSFGYLDNSIKALKVDEVEPNIDNMLSGKYPLQRPFIMVTNGDAEGLVKSFIEYVTSNEGQQIVKNEGYIPIVNK